jgi:hypothetical protein
MSIKKNKKIKNKKRRKRGQMEIMGIAVIMVFFSIGLLMFLAWSVRKQENIKPKIDMKEYQTNFVTVLLRTTTTCNKATVENLLKDISSFDQPLDCSMVGMNSLQYLTDDSYSPIKLTLDQAFVPRYSNRDYYLTYCKQDTSTISQGDFQCSCSPGTTFAWDPEAKICDAGGNNPALPDSTAIPVHYSSNLNHYCAEYSLMVQPIPTDQGTMSVAFWICDTK